MSKAGTVWVIFLALAIFVPANAQPAERVTDAVVGCYGKTVSVFHRGYGLFLRSLGYAMRMILLPRALSVRLFGFTLIYAIAKVVSVLTEDLFVVLGVVVRGLGAITGLCLSCPIGLMAVTNFLLSNGIYLTSVFLVSVSSFTPEVLSAYVHDFVFNFMEGFSDPWPTFMAIWPEIEYYMDLVEPLTGLSGMMQNTTQSLGALGSLLTLPLSIAANCVNCGGGFLNAVMYTEIGTRLCS
jgi:hypothetical protein